MPVTMAMTMWSSVRNGAGQTRRARPSTPKRVEYEIRFATNDAKKGWQDLIAAIRNPLAESWDFLTRTPLDTTPRNYALRGELRTVVRGGRSFERWQHKPTLKGDARIWFFVEDRTVYLASCFHGEVIGQRAKR